MKNNTSIRVLDGRRVLLGVSGSIAAYKGAELASKLTQAGAQVDTILTQAGSEFVTPLSFQSLTGRRAFVDRDLWEHEGHVVHIQLAKQAELCVIAPATANTLAKLAIGMADNLLSLTALALDCPLLLAPAMDAGMYEHPATQANITTLQDLGTTIIGPEIGRMASGREGWGRMTEPDSLIGYIRLALGKQSSLAGVKVVVTAGGTSEAIDPVRAITNRSSGKQGIALAQAALDLGAEVTLVAGRTDLSTPVGAERINVGSAQEMQEATLTAVEGATVLIMAAAVADFRPTARAAEKIKRKDGNLELKLEPTEDILQAVKAQRERTEHPEFVIGFAAESQDLVANAEKKLKDKGLDLIVANDISAKDAGFSVDQNRVVILDTDGGKHAVDLQPKSKVAEIVLDRVVELLSKK
jgi:phosphopantothenoylcysteine decarboxylase/phosphopantothenate--cysteine ligase